MGAPAADRAIPAGVFVMGSPEDEPEGASVEGPGHQVRLEGFLMGQTPVTQAQWRVVARLVVSNQMKVSPASGDVIGLNVEMASSTRIPINMCHQQVVTNFLSKTSCPS